MSNNTTLISEEDAIKAALQRVGVDVLGVRFDEPDTQWDVFVQSGDQAYEVEVDARNGEVVAVEEEDIEEIRAELSGSLLHEGVDGDVDD
ncbi:MAG: PepSY domain-containing protein [Planctomycetota bacterium]